MYHRHTLGISFFSSLIFKSFLSLKNQSQDGFDVEDKKDVEKHGILGIRANIFYKEKKGAYLLLPIATTFPPIPAINPPIKATVPPIIAP